MASQERYGQEEQRQIPKVIMEVEKISPIKSQDLQTTLKMIFL